MSNCEKDNTINFYVVCFNDLKRVR